MKCLKKIYDEASSGENLDENINILSEEITDCIRRSLIKGDISDDKELTIGQKILNLSYCLRFAEIKRFEGEQNYGKN